MSDIQSPQNRQEDEIDLSKILLLVLEKWKLFLFFIPVGFLIAYGYVWYIHPVYKMQATVLVEDESSDISQSILDEVGVLGKKRNIENEIAILSSRNMMERALLTQNLNINYAVDLGFKTRDLYSDLPFTLEFEPFEDTPESFTMGMTILEDGNEAEVLFSYTKPKSSDEVEFYKSVHFDEPFQNYLGNFELKKSGFFDQKVLSDSAVSQNFVLTI